MSANALPRSFGNIRQLGYVVDNVDAAVQAWTRELGVGPWTIIRNVPLHSVYRGTSSVPLIDLALSYRGDMQIELIQQKNDAPSPYRARIDRRQFGLHHTAFLSAQIDEDVRRAQAQGLAVVCDIRMPAGGRYVYVQSAALGPEVYLEFLEATPTIRQMFETGIPAAAQWDGTGGPVVIDFAEMARG